MVGVQWWSRRNHPHNMHLSTVWWHFLKRKQRISGASCHHSCNNDPYNEVKHFEHESASGCIDFRLGGVGYCTDLCIRRIAFYVQLRRGFRATIITVQSASKVCSSWITQALTVFLGISDISKNPRKPRMYDLTRTNLFCPHIASDVHTTMNKYRSWA